MNHETNAKTETETHTAAAEQVASALVRVGAAWARYGLGLAALGVETSARTLDITANALGTIADRFRDLEAKPEPNPTIDTEGR